MKSVIVTFANDFEVLAGDRHSQAASMVITPGAREGGPGNAHHGADQWLYILSGKGEAVINGQTHSLEENSLVLIQRGDRHEIRNTGSRPMKTLNFYVPPAYGTDGETLKRGE
jgi:mannose-6-phosphate isomerase-like protein (cupin superfamily)